MVGMKTSLDRLVLAGLALGGWALCGSLLCGGLCVGLCGGLSGCAARGATCADRAGLQGTWLAQSESLNGHTKRVDFRYVFSGDQVTFRDETGMETTYTFTLNAGDGLTFMAIVPAESPDSPPVSVAYALDGDALTLVIAPPGSRPTDISDRNDQELIVCRRKRP